MDVLTIKEVCEKYQINQSALARRFGVPLRTVQGWYLGERRPPEYVVRMIVELLQVDAADAIKAQREARQKMIREKHEQLPQEKREEYFFGSNGNKEVEE